jgi:hypothetical protein
VFGKAIDNSIGCEEADADIGRADVDRIAGAPESRRSYIRADLMSSAIGETLE